MNYAKALLKIFDAANDLDELISLALYCRDQINSQLFIYAYCVVLAHRYDTDNIELPQLFEIRPNEFFKKSTIIQVREELHKTENQRRARQAAGINENVPRELNQASIRRRSFFFSLQKMQMVINYNFHFAKECG